MLYVAVRCVVFAATCRNVSQYTAVYRNVPHTRLQPAHGNGAARRRNATRRNATHPRCERTLTAAAGVDVVQRATVTAVVK